MSPREIYLDYNSTTPLGAGVARAMAPYFENEFGNPSSIHRAGQRARHAIENAREALALAIESAPQDVIFTSGGTEANFLAVTGTVMARVEKGSKKIVVSSIEHPSVLGAAEECARRMGLECALLPVRRDGTVALEEAAKIITGDTAIVSVMHANNETGVVQPIRELSRLARNAGVPFHVDAVQTFGKCDVRVDELGCDLASFSAHKIYGPKGVGALYVRPRTPFRAAMRGGHQEKNLRPGTEPVSGIAGFGAALEWKRADREREAERLRDLRNKFREYLERDPGGISVNGDSDLSLSGTLNVAFEGVDGATLAMKLDLEGVFVSTGAACSAGTPNPSHVLLAMGLSESEAKSSIRFSLGRGTREEDLLEAASITARAVRLNRDKTHAH